MRRATSSITAAAAAGWHRRWPWESMRRSTVVDIPVTQPFPSRKLGFEELRKLLAQPVDQKLIRNFSIVAHIDHGKTTLSDAILRRTQVVESKDMCGVGNSAVYMDKLEVERERGITIKAQTATMFVTDPVTQKEFMLNLIDTPGHIDFAFEVHRSLAACEGAALLVDANQGVEAQTMANFHLALDRGLDMVPVLTKLDTMIDEGLLRAVETDIEDATGLLAKEFVMTAARQGLGIEAVLSKVFTEIRPPCGDINAPLRALLFDAWFGQHTRTFVNIDVRSAKTETVLCAVRVVDGAIRTGDVVTLMHSEDDKEYRVNDVGIMHPEPISTGVLYPGMVGYVDLGMRTRKEANVGDTICIAKLKSLTKPAATFKQLRPVIFSSFFPNDGESFEHMKGCIDKLCINDPTVTMSLVKCEAFGPGLQLGFLGALHQQVFQDRLVSEHDLDVLVTPSQVFYKMEDAEGNQQALTVTSWIDNHHQGKYLEPVVRATIVCKEELFRDVMSVTSQSYRAELIDSRPMDGHRVAMKFRMPLAELIQGLQVTLMRMSHGFASLEYDEPTYEEADLVKIDFTVNKKTLTSLSTITVKQHSLAVAQRMVKVLRENIDAAQVNLPIQASIGGKIIARETVSARRKDVLAKIHAGDYSRKAKKLNHQKIGKARLAKRMVGQFSIDSDTLAAVLGATKV